MAIEPQSYRDIIYPTAATAKLIENLVSGALRFPFTGKSGILIYGKPGLGKSTLAKLLPRDMQMVLHGDYLDPPSHYDVKAGSNGPAILNSLHAQATNVNPHGVYKYFVLDEVNNLGAKTLASLKVVLDIPDTVFIMTTNNVEDIPHPVISRCHMVNMYPANPEAYLPQAHELLAYFGITSEVSDAALLPIIGACAGDIRQIANQMQLLALDLR